MKHLVTLNLEMQVTVDEETAARLQKETAEEVLRRCFPGMTRAVVRADLLDEELLDNSVNSLDLINSQITPSAQEYVPSKDTFISVL